MIGGLARCRDAAALWFSNLLWTLLFCVSVAHDGIARTAVSFNRAS
jgi:hypothetical protein